MKFFSLLGVIFFLLLGVPKADDNIRFININYIVNNSNAGVLLNKIIENKNKKIDSELKDLAMKLENKKSINRFEIDPGS